MTDLPQQIFSKRKVCRMWLKPYGHWNVDMVVGDDFHLASFMTNVRGSGAFISPDLSVGISFDNILFFAVLEVDAPPSGKVVQFQTVQGGLQDMKPEGAA